MILKYEKILVVTVLVAFYFAMSVFPVFAHSHYITNEKNGDCHYVANSDKTGGPHNDNPSGDVMHETVHSGTAGEAFDKENNPVDVSKEDCPE